MPDQDDDAASTDVFSRHPSSSSPPVTTSGAEFIPRETLVARARDALGRTLRVPAGNPAAELAHLDRLVELGRDREVGLRALLLRHALAGRLAVAATAPEPGDTADTEVPDGADTAGSLDAKRVDELLDELLALVAEHGLSLFGVDAQALVARRALLIDDEESALAAVSTALSHLEEPVLVDHAGTAREHRHNMCSTYRLVAGSLVSLGMHEVADALLDRARGLAADINDRVRVAACDHERVRLHASWGLRLERAGRSASDRLARASAVAAELAAGDGELLGTDHVPLRQAAAVLARPDPGPGRTEPQRLLALRDVALLDPDAEHPSLHDQLVVDLARARALERAGDPAGAAAALERVRDRRPRGERSLLLSITRELSRLRTLLVTPDGGTPDGEAATGAAVGALRHSTDELEAELWSLHQARVLSLRARVAHDRLRREHGQVAAQALSDPLTGLPNRRALDDVLRRLVATRPPDGVLPPAVAMVDVDRFKQVNDALSHARGDEVLRLVAGALRGSLRVDDVVARYGGDEFVVVLPATPPRAAGVALARAVRTVSGLANGEAEGVTLSVGVVAVSPPEDTRAVLARADAVMYGVKRSGGDGVRVIERPGGPVEAVDVSAADAATHSSHGSHSPHGPRPGSHIAGSHIAGWRTPGAVTTAVTDPWPMPGPRRSDPAAPWIPRGRTRTPSPAEEPGGRT